MDFPTKFIGILVYIKHSFPTQAPCNKHHLRSRPRNHGTTAWNGGESARVIARPALAITRDGVAVGQRNSKIHHAAGVVAIGALGLIGHVCTGVVGGRDAAAALVAVDIRNALSSPDRMAAAVGPGAGLGSSIAVTGLVGLALGEGEGETDIDNFRLKVGGDALAHAPLGALAGLLQLADGLCARTIVRAVNVANRLVPVVISQRRAHQEVVCPAVL